jgi:spore germination protein GerM
VDNTAVEDSIEVSGRARVKDREVAIVVKDGAGNELVQTTADLLPAATGDFTRFSQTVALLPQRPGGGSIEVFLRDQSGNQVSEKTTRVLAFVAPNTVPVKVFFNNSKLDPEITCTKVFAVDRQVSSKTQIYRSVIEELIKGPTEEEKGSGYSSLLPDGVILKSIAADANGIVTADFNEALDRGVAGSCRVNSIRAQIVTTLEQFPEVRGVVISIGNRVEDVLQP